MHEYGYESGFRSVLPYYRLDQGKPCGKGHIAADKKCRYQGAEFSPEESQQIAASMSAVNRRRRKIEGWSDKTGWDEESPNNPKWLGVDDRKYATTREWESAWTTAKDKITKSKPDGYFGKDWTVGDEYEFTKLLKLPPEEYKKARSSTMMLRKRKREGKSIRTALGAIGIPLAATAIILGGHALMSKGGANDRVRD